MPNLNFGCTNLPFAAPKLPLVPSGVGHFLRAYYPVFVVVLNTGALDVVGMLPYLVVVG